jgi:hypothetical protein
MKIMTGPYILSEEFLKKVSKVGKGSKFAYRGKFDPVTISDIKKSRLKKQGML